LHPDRFQAQVKKTILLLIFAALLPVTCGRQKAGSRSQPTTQTIAPATAQPSADSTGTDAVTQTVDIDDSRSESDGMASASNTTSAKKAPAKTPAKKKGRK